MTKHTPPSLPSILPHYWLLVLSFSETPLAAAPDDCEVGVSAHALRTASFCKKRGISRSSISVKQRIFEVCNTTYKSQQRFRSVQVQINKAAVISSRLIYNQQLLMRPTTGHVCKWKQILHKHMGKIMQVDYHWNEWTAYTR